MACICAASNGVCTAMPRHRSTRQRLGVRQSSAALGGRENLSTPPVTKENPVHGRWRDVFPSLQDVRRAGKKRRRATALQDAARGSGGSGERGSVLECGSPLPLWGGQTFATNAAITTASPLRIRLIFIRHGNFIRLKPVNRFHLRRRRRALEPRRRTPRVLARHAH